MYVHKKLEKNILPLVHAINETGLFTTYSSCEGHFDTENDENEPAIVYFDANTGVTEEQILNFFGQVLTIYSESAPGTYANFTIAKIYIPSINDIIDYAYVMEVKPIGSFITDEEKQKAVNTLTQKVCDIVKSVSKNKKSLKKLPERKEPRSSISFLKQLIEKDGLASSSN